MISREYFDQLMCQDATTEGELLTLFDMLEPVACEDILSRWRGGGFNTGHWLLPALVKLRWFGKWFVSPSDAKPMVCWDDTGALSSSQAMNGEASLAMMAFRGKISATVVYDGVPMFGHLRRVDDETLLGAVSGKAIGSAELLPDGKHQFFFLDRISAWPAPLTVHQSPASASATIHCAL
ncbi:DUF4334 domain-containing protein [Sphingomonas sp. OK281]|uniref:DUF4334 domain-containing protein n=1 Tax=Sphingomonas sp. OK281 TaxID=1881067 RepID=UPI0008E31ABA|nr:DUF4334 domain-containing protein [Sphingomonas sp. OK281]SFO01893.1 protein of unknown function [Sphingomonas sp. OK281]